MAKSKQPSTHFPLRLEYRDAAELKENPRNWRKHPAHQAKALEAVIDEVGWAGAALLNETTGHLIDGHLRKKIGKGKIPVLIGRWSEEQERKILATLDPIAGLAEADRDRLETLLKSIQTDSQPIMELIRDLAAENRIDSLLGEADLDAVPEPPDNPITRPGDLWILGDHRLLCGDSGKPEDVDRLLDGAKIHMGNLDPPYNVKVEPRSNNAIRAGLSSFEATRTKKKTEFHHQGLDLDYQLM
jgi:hypothetical protein